MNKAELDQTLHVNEDETPSVPTNHTMCGYVECFNGFKWQRASEFYGPTAEIFNPRSHIHCAKDSEDIGKSRKSSFLDKELSRGINQIVYQQGAYGNYGDYQNILGLSDSQTCGCLMLWTGPLLQLLSLATNSRHSSQSFSSVVNRSKSSVAT